VILLGYRFANGFPISPRRFGNDGRGRKSDLGMTARVGKAIFGKVARLGKAIWE